MKVNIMKDSIYKLLAHRLGPFSNVLICCLLRLRPSLVFVVLVVAVVGVVVVRSGASSGT